MKSIRINTLIIITACLLSAVRTAGQPVTAVLEGSAPTYAGDELIFHTYSNMISFRETEVARCTVDDSGNFACPVSLDDTRLIFINLGTYNCYFFAEPGITYNLHFPAKRDRSQSEEINPYFEPARVHIAVKPARITSPSSPTGGNKEDLNFLIRAFNDSFYPHYYMYVINTATSNPDKSDINKDIKQLTEPFDSTHHDFFRAYMEYRIGLLKMFGDKQNTGKIGMEYFAARPVLYNNPGYMELFNEVFNDYFLTFAEGNPKNDLLPVINRQKSLSVLNSILKKNDLLSGDSLRELVIIKGIYDAFYNEQFSRPALLLLLDSISYTSGNKKHAEYARDIKTQVTGLLTGYEPPSFKLLDRDSNLVSLSDFSGKYVYLNFCTSFSYSCIKEFELLRDMNDRQKDRLQIITIIMDGEHASLNELIGKYDFEWVFLHHGLQPRIRTDYDIKAFPAYFLIGPDGKLILSPAPSPAENFEQLFFQVMRSRGDI